jgi:hypothetical protein
MLGVVIQSTKNKTATTGHLNVEVVVTEIATRVCRLHNHLFPAHRARGECKPGRMISEGVR